VIFGGTEFIGTHLSQILLESDPQCRVVLVDLNPPRKAAYTKGLQRALANGRAAFLSRDVRNPIEETEIGSADVVFNLAAVHRELGYHPIEYFQTNIFGAENICAYASAVGAKHIVFMSSISVYGQTDEAKTEESLPAPETAYGSSKLLAESVHRSWQQATPGRRLLVLRPGAIFGPGESGNVTRLVRSLLKGHFMYVGNCTTRVAGGYLKELCEAIRFAMEYQIDSGECSMLLNFSMDSPTPMETFVDTVREVARI
jgi:nucleoside-diphosphate-sugar epimerase